MGVILPLFSQYTFVSNGESHEGDEEDGKVYHPGIVHAQDQGQACKEGWYIHSLWQDNQSQGSSSYKDCQGLLRQGSERQHLNSSCAFDQFWTFLTMRSPRSSTSECFSLATAQDGGLSTSFERRSL